METCKNCDTLTPGNFCPNCGQKSTTAKITFRNLSKDFLATILNLDAPVYKTIARLSTRPGALIRSYIRGKRKSFYNPLRYLVFSMALYLLVKVLIDFDPVATFNAMKGAESSYTVSSSTVSEPSLDAGQFFSRNINILIFILSFTFAAVAKLFFWRSGITLAEYMVLGLYSVGHYMLIGSMIMLMTLISPKFFILNYLIVLVYFSFVIISFHEGHWLWRSLKGVLAVLFGYFLFAFLGFTISAFILNTFY